MQEIAGHDNLFYVFFIINPLILIIWDKILKWLFSLYKISILKVLEKENVLNDGNTVSMYYFNYTYKQDTKQIDLTPIKRIK